ncbi:MAG: hypothetical protein FJ255_00735 [Phycisphaerae bacterium]|nr:hypothetical protein [Phycisphaerae bacterium]
MVSAVPLRLSVGPTGEWTLHTAPIEPAPLAAVRHRLPDSIPVEPANTRGGFDPGLRLQLLHDPRSPNHPVRYPAEVWLMPDGRWVIDDGFLSRGAGWQPDDWSRPLPHSVSMPVRICVDTALERVEPVRAVGRPEQTTITYTYAHAGAPAGMNEADVRRALDRAAATWRQLLTLEGLELVFEFSWQSLPAGVLAEANVYLDRDHRSYFGIRDAMQAAMNGPDFDPWEEFVYDFLPAGTSISFARLGNPNASTTRLMLPVPLLNKWYNARLGRVMVTTFNSNFAAADFDLDGRVGTPPIDPTAVDFEGVVIHEMGHHMGFVSEAGLAAQFHPHLSNWDLFRFATALGPDINPQEFQTAHRQLTRGEGAIAATALNSATHVYDLDSGSQTGEDYQASHWRDYLVADPDYIGMMDTGQELGESLLLNNSYFTSADLRAFDIMGYDIAQNAVAPAPAPAQPVNPAPGQPRSPVGPIALEWSPGVAPVDYTVFVLDRGPIGTWPGELVWLERDLAGPPSTIPPDTLLFNRRYDWTVSTSNWRGYARASSNFNTGLCQGDWNGDAAVDFNDLLMFLNLFNAQDPRADIDGDGVVDFNDYLAFLNLYGAPC